MRALAALAAALLATIALAWTVMAAAPPAPAREGCPGSARTGEDHSGPGRGGHDGDRQCAAGGQAATPVATATADPAAPTDDPGVVDPATGPATAAPAVLDTPAATGAGDAIQAPSQPAATTPAGSVLPGLAVGAAGLAILALVVAGFSARRQVAAGIDR